MNKKDFLYGLSLLAFDGAEVGYIEKNSFEWGGTAPESVDVEAEQVPDAPVLVLAQKNGTIAPKFNMIQLNYKNLLQLLGGSLLQHNVDGANVTYGWRAPTDLVQLSGPFTIDTPSGKRIKIANAMLLAHLDGKLSLTEVSKVACELRVMKPSDGRSAPYEIVDIEVDDETEPEG